jgi:phosphoesterase RecJ-like protein
MSPTTNPEVAGIVQALRAGQRFVVSSHARPDGDAVGSSMAMALALRALGKEARVVFKDPAPEPLRAFPGVAGIEIADRVDAPFDAAIVMECGSLSRTGVTGLDRSPVINIDHHPGNDGYGRLTWFDPTAAACAEMVYHLIGAIGAPISADIAVHVYVAILTDTGSFHYSSISPRTFDICRELVEAGVDPVATARQVYDSNSLGRLKIVGAVLSAMRVEDSGRIAVLAIDEETLRAAGGTYDDIEGLINEPLTVKKIQAVIFFKHVAGEEFRVSMRSKGAIDIGEVAKLYGGGGHRNAAGCTMRGSREELQKALVERVSAAISSGLRDG